MTLLTILLIGLGLFVGLTIIAGFGAAALVDIAMEGL